MNIATQTSSQAGRSALKWGGLLVICLFCLAGCSRSYGNVKNAEIDSFAPFAEPEDAILLYRNADREIARINLRDGEPPKTAEPAPTEFPEGTFDVPRRLDKTECERLGGAALERDGVGGSVYLVHPDGRRDALVGISGASDGAFDGTLWPNYYFFTPSCKSVVFSHGYRLMLVNVQTEQVHYLTDTAVAVMAQDRE